MCGGHRKQFGPFYYACCGIDSFVLANQGSCCFANPHFGCRADFFVPARGRFPLAVDLSRTAVLQSCCRKAAIQERRDTELSDWQENDKHE